ncbi:hypothetical protein HZC07_03765 [Candidatus Micrarchaeota archaeon]|nr:hypothetical protein [Candidatus Micrarchaeota archaeon]
MADRYIGQVAVPDVKHAVRIEDAITGLRREITTNCSNILQRARTINAAAHGTFRIKHWESLVSGIKQSEMETSSIDELEQLRARTNTIALEMEEFSQGLI